jgi:hypothetical protein
LDQEDSQDGSQQKEDEEEDEEGSRPPPSKRGRMVLHSDKAALAGSMHSIQPASAAHSQYHQESENESEDGDVTGQRNDQQSDELEGDMDNDMLDPRDIGEASDQVGFQDNGVCFQKFYKSLRNLLFTFSYLS